MARAVLPSLDCEVFPILAHATQAVGTRAPARDVLVEAWE